MKKIISLLLVVIGLSACKKARYNRNCCTESSAIITFEGGYAAMPNAFTPNGDGENDTFSPITEGVREYTLTIKSGNKTILEDEEWAWDGTIKRRITSGIYDYTIDIETNNGELITASGQVCSIPDPANACLKEPENCRFSHQFVTGSTPDEVGFYDAENIPGFIFCDE